MPLNPKVAALLQMIENSKYPPLHTLTVAEARQAYERSAPILDVPPAPLHRVEDLSVPVRDGSRIDARLYLPREASWAAPLPALIYLHGGGFTVGSLATHDALCRLLARGADCAVLSVAYRLAPEHRFPSAVHDTFDALHWLHAESHALGLDAGRIAIGGDSAGGTLATVGAVLARDAGLPLVLQMLLYPGTCGYQDTASHRRLAHGYFLPEETIQWFFENYIRTRDDRDDWRFAPLDGAVSAPDFSGLAPAWIAVAEYDPLLDEGIAYAEKLRLAGNRVELHRFDGMIHEFFKMRRLVPDVAQAHEAAIAALRRAFDAT
ncbi:MAG: alpha/beta hydrolase [Burkholderiales bacterium]|nr:alpha/beta hydrolase [Burkholderiales bacterium]